jgi:hypothetical protein
VILGGSRALRFQPAYLQQRVGLSGFNAAVTGARPEDAWAFVSLLHERFPAARLTFLWVVLADEFGPKALDPGLICDPCLGRFFPAGLVTAQARWDSAHLVTDPMQTDRVFAPDGHVVRDAYDLLYPRPGADASGVRYNIRQELQAYSTTTARLSPRSVRYFEKTLALMSSLDAAPPVIVAAPVDLRILAATADRGWSVRHGLMLRLLAKLRSHHHFSLADMSRAITCGCTARDFFDGIHMRPSGTHKVIDAILRRFPAAL